MEKQNHKKEGAPYGSRNAWKHGKYCREVRHEIEERGKFYRECYNTLKNIQKTLKGVRYEKDEYFV